MKRITASSRPSGDCRSASGIGPSLGSPTRPGPGANCGEQLALELGGSGGTLHAAVAWSAFSFFCCALRKAARCFVLLCVLKYAARSFASRALYATTA